MTSRIPGLITTIAFVVATAALPLNVTAQAIAAPAPTAQVADTAAAPADAVPPVAAPATNPYGLKAMIDHGDAVSKTVLTLLLIMSMGSWYILMTKLWATQKLQAEARRVRASFFKNATLADGVKGLPGGSAFQFVATSAIEASNHHEGTLTENIDHSSWVSMQVDRAVGQVNRRVQGGLGFLATVGSTSPFIGLFGTVWGILQALTAIGVAGQASIDKVAGPVGEALIMTALGLAVAVPAVLGYNWLVNRNKAVMDEVRTFAADLHGVLMGAAIRAPKA